MRAVEKDAEEILTVDSPVGFDWKGEAADAAILSGMSFFATFGAAFGAAGVPLVNAVLSAVVAAGGMFCTILAAKRKLLKAA